MVSFKSVRLLNDQSSVKRRAKFDEYFRWQGFSCSEALRTFFDKNSYCTDTLNPLGGAGGVACVACVEVVPA